jgi:PAS domain S-box-containing protein
MKDKDKTEEELIAELRLLRRQLAFLIRRDDSARRLSDLEHVITCILAESHKFSDVIPKILQLICESLEWKKAILWGVDWHAKLLRQAMVWPETNDNPHSLPLCSGMLNHILACNGIPSANGFIKEINPLKFLTVYGERLQGDLVIPLKIAGEILGVIEFFTGRIGSLDEELRGLMADVGNQISRFIESARAEEALPETEELYRIVTEAASDAMIMIDQEGTILYANRSAERIFGYDVKEMQGQSVIKLIPEHLRYSFIPSIRRRFRNGEKLSLWERTELPGLHKSGSVIHLEVTFGETVKDGKRIFIGIARDITERYRIEKYRAELLVREQEARKTAEEANRAKDEFLATVSHELRTPLTAILGWARLLESEDLNEPTHAKAVDAIIRNAKSQSQIINDLLDYSRIIMNKLPLDFSCVEPAPVIDSAIRSLSLAAQNKNIRLLVSLNNDTGTILADPERLKQIVWNLLSNAIKFTPKGGKIRVLLERSNTHITIIVSDTGEGIKADFLPHVFERFQQADGTITRKHGGLGLGLAIVRNLVELHNGKVRVHSEGERRGATFTVTIPLADSPANLVKSSSDHLRVANLAMSCPELDHLRVLIVDDEVAARELYSDILKQQGASVTAVGSASEALDLLDCWQPDLIVSDIGMPVEDGYELIKKVRMRPPERGGLIPAVALTTYSRDQDCRQAISTGYQSNIAKPVQPSDLVTAIANLAKVKN